MLIPAFPPLLKVTAFLVGGGGVQITCIAVLVPLFQCSAIDVPLDDVRCAAE